MYPLHEFFKNIIENRAWGMGHGAWGMGHGAWGMEHGGDEGSTEKLFIIPIAVTF
jgi:hypothetical protein